MAKKKLKEEKSKLVNNDGTLNIPKGKGCWYFLSECPKSKGYSKNIGKWTKYNKPTSNKNCLKKVRKKINKECKIENAKMIYNK